MHLAPGSYFFRSTIPFDSNVVYKVDADGIETPAGKLLYEAGPPECYRLGTTAVRLTGGASGTYEATSPGAPAVSGTYGPAS